MANLKKILIIDDDLSIRFVLKKILSRQLSNVDIFSSEDGVQGIGYAFVLKPDLIVIDSTLPKYSGRELVDFISSNDNFKDTPIILLHEDDKFVDDLPKNFVQITKADKLFPENLVNEVIKEIGNVDDEPHKLRSFKFLNFLSRKIIRYSNSSYVDARNSRKGNAFKRLFNLVQFLFHQILSGFYLSFFYMLVGRKENEVNIDQKKKDQAQYRSKIYPAVGVSVALTLFISLHLFITLGGILTFGLFGTQQVAAASYTWDGGGLTNNWSDCDNWSTNICPVAADSITFNGTSTKDSVVDAGFNGTINDITVASGYTGTITQQRSLTISSTFTISDGVYTPSNQMLSIGGAFTMNTGSTFTASSLTTTYWGGITINGGTFNHNNGTISLSGGNATLNCNNVTFNLVVLASTGGTKTINSNCALPLGNNPSTGSGGAVSVSGTISGAGTITTNGTFTFNAGSIITGFSGYSAATNSNFVVSGATLNFSSYTTFVMGAGLTLSSGTLTLPSGADLNGALTISGGTFNAPSGNMFLAGALAISGAPTFNHNNGTITLDGGSVALSCNNVIFNLVVFNNNNTKTISSNCSLPLGNNPTIPSSISLSGTLSGSGTLTHSANTFTINAGGNLSGFSGFAPNALTITGGDADFSAYTSFVAASTVILNSGSINLPSNSDVNGALSISGGTFNAPSGTMTLAGALTISGSPTFNHNNGTITFDGSTATLSCNNVIFNLVSFTGQTGTKTINSNCNLPIGNNPVIPTAISLSGTLSGSGTLTQSAATLTVNTTGTLSGFSGLTLNNLTVSGGNVDLSGYQSFSSGIGTVSINSGTLSLPPGSDLNGSLNITGGTFNAPAGNLYIASHLTISGSPIFNHNNGTVIFDSTSNATLSCNNVTFNTVTFAHTGGTKTVSSNCTFPLGNNPNLSTAVTSAGVFTGTGTITGPSGFTLNAGANLIGFSGISATFFTISGATIDLSSLTTLTVSSTTNISSGSVTFPNNTDLNGVVTISGGTVNAPSGNMTIAVGFTISGSSTFNHNNGTITFDGNSGTLSCNNATFNLVSFTGLTGAKTVNSNCNLPLGADPTIPNSITLNGTLSGSGKLTTTAGALIMNTGSALSGFNKIEVVSLTVSGATVDFSSYTSFVNSSNVVLNSGSLSLPSGADLNNNLTISGGTLNAPNGSLYIAGNFTVSGSGAFNHNNGTVIFDGSVGGILTCNNATFNLVRFEHTLPARTVNVGCNLPLGNNPILSAPISLNGILSGTGILTALVPAPGAYSLRLNGAASISGFTGLDIARLEQGSANSLDLSSYTNVSIGTLNTFGGSTFVAPPVMTIKDQILYISGTFNHNNGTIIFSNPNTTIGTPQSGTDLTLYNLTKEIGGTITFPRYNEFSKGVIVQGTLKLKGTAGNLLALQSNLTGSQWYINPQGPIDIEYLSVRDSNNIGTVISAAGKNITDLGNNTGWSFNAPSISNIAPTNLTDGSFTSDNTPSFSFDIADLNVSDTVQYNVQIDNSSDFGTPEVNYTSSLEAQGSKTYTVTSPLLDGSYYMRIRGLDQGGGIGEYNVVNSGNIAFKIDATAPTGSLILGHVTDSTNPQIYIVASASDTFGVTEMIYSEKSDFSDASYIPFKQSSIYTLSSGYGTKTVYIKYKDAAENVSSTYSNTINYTQVPEVIEPPVEEIPEEEPDTETPDIDDEGSIGTGSVVVAFRVLDGNNNPIQNVTIKLVDSDLQATTDENGIVVFDKAMQGKQQLLGVYNNQEFIKEIDITDNSTVITIVLDDPNAVSPLVVVGLVSVIGIMGGVIFYLIRRKKITTN